MAKGIICMSEFLEGIVKDLDDEYTTIAAEGKSSAEFSGTIDTGSVILNAIFSGSLYGGVAYNKLTSDFSKYFQSLESFMDEFTTIFFRQLENR